MSQSLNSSMPKKKSSSKKPGISTTCTSTPSPTSASGMRHTSPAIPIPKPVTTQKKRRTPKKIQTLETSISEMSVSTTPTSPSGHPNKENIPPTLKKPTRRPSRTLSLKMSKGQRAHIEWVRALSPYELDKDKYRADVSLALDLLTLLQETEQITPEDKILLDRLLAPTEDISEEEAPPPPLAKKQRTCPVTGAPMDTAVRTSPTRLLDVSGRVIMSVIERGYWCDKHQSFWPGVPPYRCMLCFPQ